MKVDPTNVPADSGAAGAAHVSQSQRRLHWAGPAAVLVVGVGIALWLRDALPAWAFMWLLAIAIYSACKAITWLNAPNKGRRLHRDFGYLFAWPGLDANAFLSPRQREPAPPTREWLFAIAKLLFGCVTVFGLARLVPPGRAYLTGWVGMVGIVFALHFGLFHVLSCAWRSFGVCARPLMNWPISSTSLSEFWGRRWNTAFRDLTHQFLFRPLAPRLGAWAALMVGFALSGVVHDLVISVPASGGYGGPTLYFVLQGAGILFERSTTGRSLRIGRGLRGRLFSALILLGPVPLLFHPPFVVDVFVPFLRAIGAV